jgi:opacity protein-like surface antigen
MNLKSLLFGSAAVLAAGTGAQAADLPVAEPVEYVRICDAFGTGFYYIPGTDTCLRVSGRVRVEAHYVDEFGDDDDDDDDGGDFFGIDQNTNNYTTRARGNMRLDARTQTDLGLIRAFAEFQVTVGPGSSSEVNANYDGAGVDLSAAFIQISNDMGTFTAGHTGSFFDFFGSLGFGTRINIDDNTTEQTLFAYTFGGGNGFSATLSIEDPASSGRRLNGTEDYEGQEWPDLVGNFRVDQDWGSAQIMGVLHHIHDKEGVVAGEGPDDDDGLGWALGAGASFNFAGLGFSAQGGYADGALGYITTDPGGVGDLSADFDGTDDDDDDVDTNTAWNIRAGVSAEFTPTLTGQVDASYTDVDGDDDDDDDDDDDFGYTFWGAKATLIWSPVSGLIMGPEIAYNNIDFGDDDDDDDDDDDGDSDDVWGVMWRIQRDF